MIKPVKPSNPPGDLVPFDSEEGMGFMFWFAAFISLCILISGVAVLFGRGVIK